MTSPAEDRPEDGHAKLGTCGQLKHMAEQLQLDFELDFFERILEQQPDYVDVLRVQGNNLTAKGLHVRGLEADRRLAESESALAEMRGIPPSELMCTEKV